MDKGVYLFYLADKQGEKISSLLSLKSKVHFFHLLFTTHFQQLADTF